MPAVEIHRHPRANEGKIRRSSSLEEATAESKFIESAGDARTKAQSTLSLTFVFTVAIEEVPKAVLRDEA